MLWLIEYVGGKVTPENILKFTPEELATVGLTRPKSRYIHGLANDADKFILGTQSFTSLKADLCQEKKEVLHLAGIFMEHFLEGSALLRRRKMEVLHLAGTFMEHFLEGSVSLGFGKLTQKRRFVTLLIWVNVPMS